MVRELNSDRRAARSGTARSVIVFVHGYGADGADLMGLAGPLAQYLPDTAFWAPDAPDRSLANPMGYQWFPIPWLDGSSEETAREGMLAAAADLDAFLDKVLETEGLSDANLAVIGFSQGTMMALHVLPRRAEPCAGIVGYSGRLLAPELLAGEVTSRPPILLAHGDADEVVPPASMPQAAQALEAAGFDVEAHALPGLGHGISEDGLRLALIFLQAKLGYREE
ncbi:MAG: alpha/beta fold hydrolase [Pseudomonadota bacterium]